MYAQAAALETFNYYGDRRVQSAMRDHAFTVQEQGPRTAIIVLNECLIETAEEGLEEGDETTLEARYTVPTALQVCDCCNGSGTTVNPSIDCGGLTQDDFDQDPDFQDAYFSGTYDIQCPECKGKNVVPDAHAMLASLPMHVRQTILAYQRELDADLRERLSELRMGC